MIKRISFLFSILCIAALSLHAQGRLPVIPNDPDVRIGKAPNGMTYYIRHNDKPAKQAEFFILHDVGAIQEDTAQNGLAHFLEHMAFNGTKNFPGKNLINYMETIGVKFGANLNAMTGQEYTQYNMSAVPLLREGIIDSCLLVLHDWSHFISLLPKEIDNERSVIIEELRGGNTGSRRVQEALMPVTMGPTRYAYRNVIGTEAGLRTFSYKELEDFYHKWYRPDLQAIVVVGDFDVDQMEKKILSTMADIPAPTDHSPKIPVKIPGNKEPVVGIATDPEVTNTSVALYIKRDPVPKEMNNTVPIAQFNTALYMAASMASTRLSEMAQKPNAPFIGARIQNGAMTSTCDVIFAGASARPGQAATAFEALYTEVERVKRHGFTESELERVKANLMRNAEISYEARDDRRNEDFVDTYLNNFRNNTPMPDAKTEWKVDSMVISSITLDMVNMLISRVMIAENQVVTMTGPSSSPIPTKEEVAALIAKVRASNIEPYADNTVKEPLISTTLKGSPVAKTEAGKFGSTVWTLKNGIRVVLKPTDFKADELMLSATSYGGRSIIPDADLPSAELLPTVISASGVGKFSSIDLSKQLTGKAAKAGPAIGAYSNGINGACSSKDLETMLQLVYLYFTSPRFDRGDFDVMMDKIETSLSNAENDPGTIFKKEFAKAYYNDNFRCLNMDMKRLGLVKFEDMERLYRQLYNNAADFTFIFTGSIDPEKAKPLIEKYIGSLPVNQTRLTYKDDKIAPVKGKVDKTIAVPMQTSKTTVLTVLSGEMPYTLETVLTATIFKQILDIRYTESVREEKGGTYGVSVSMGQQDVPRQRYSLSISFDTDPAMAGELIPIILEEIRELAQEGPKAEDMAKIKEFMVKQRADNLKQNSTWAGYLGNWYLSGKDYATDYDKTLAGIDAAKIKAMAAKILADGNVFRFVMNPETAK